jgi:hypothetical protein
MRFISSLTWIKQGVSKTPTRIKLEQDEMKRLFSEIGKSSENVDEEGEQSDDEKSEAEEEAAGGGSVGEEAKINRKYKLDNYDQEGRRPIFLN